MKPTRSTATKERAFVKAALGTRKNAQHPRVAVNPGYGPGHAENAMEGSMADPAAVAAVARKRAMLGMQGGTSDLSEEAKYEDAVDEAILRKARNRPDARRRVRGPQFNPKGGSPAESAAMRQLWDKYGLTAPEEQIYPNIPYEEVESQMAQKGKHTVQAVQGNTDSVPAMLTPREAVLNRNAAEMAGRGKIAKLNEAGNKLAVQGVDLASGGKTMKTKRMQKGGLVPQAYGDAKFGQGNDPRRLGGPAPGGEPLPVGWDAWQRLGGGGPFGGPKPGGGMTTLPAPWRDPGPVGGGYGTLPAPWQGGGGLSGGYGGWGGGLPSGGGAQGWGGGIGGGPGIYGKASGSFYPQAGASATKPLQGFQGGVSDLGGPGIGANWGAPPQLQSGDIGSLVAALTKAAQQQGISGQQLQGLLSVLQGAGGAGGGSSQLYGEGGAPMSAMTASGGFQGGISDIGYPPFVGPGMDYHADKGSSWVGPYDPSYIINRQP